MMDKALGRTLEKLGVNIGDEVFVSLKQLPMVPQGPSVALLPQLNGTFRGLSEDGQWFHMRAKMAEVALEVDSILQIGVPNRVQPAEATEGLG